MTAKKKEIKEKPIAKKKLLIKWNGSDHQISKPGDYFVAKGVEGRVVKINTPVAGINDVSINGAVFTISNKDLRTQINKTKGYFQKKVRITKGEYVVGKKLTVKQELFCNHYIKNDELRGNGTLSYNEAFDFKLGEKDRTRKLDKDNREIGGTSEYDKAYNNCGAQASVLLKNLKIQEENKRLWNELLNDTIVDSRLSKIITRGDDKDSLGGIREYNKMNGRVTDLSEVKETKEVIVKLSKKQIDKMSPKECDEYLAKLIDE